MAHGRMIRPPVAGAVPVKFDEVLGQGHPGRARGARGPFVPRRRRRHRMGRDPGRASSSRSNGRTSSRRSRTAPTRSTITSARRRCAARGIDGKQVGNVDEAFKTAARVIEHEYEWPFQSHASMGPGCGVVDARPDRATVWTGSPKPHYCRDGVAAILGMKPNQVEGISHQAAGAYGRNDAGDACIDAAVLSKAVGRPVRAAILARGRHRLGSEGPRLGPSRAGRPRLVRQRDRLRVLHQGVLALGRADQREPAASARSPATSSARR